MSKAAEKAQKREVVPEPYVHDPLRPENPFADMSATDPGNPDMDARLCPQTSVSRLVDIAI